MKKQHDNPGTPDKMKIDEDYMAMLDQTYLLQFPKENSLVPLSKVKKQEPLKRNHLDLKNSVFLYSETPALQPSELDYPLNALAYNGKSMISPENHYVKHFTKEETYIRFAPSPKDAPVDLEQASVTTTHVEP